MVATSYEYDTTGSDLYTHKKIASIATSTNHLDIITYCMEIGLIPNKMLCPTCCNSMKLVWRNNINTYAWRCGKRACDKRFSVRTGTIFAYSKCEIGTLLMLLFYFASDSVKAKAVGDFCGLAKSTVTDWYDICRGYCSKEMMSVDMKVGGPGHVVEIDETSLAKKQKYRRGKKYEEFWLFGGWDRTTKKWFATVTFDDRTKPTLTAKIAECILPHTHIISDMFGSYVSSNQKHTLANNPKLKHLAYMHTWVNHSKNFKDPHTGAHTNGIEGAWETKLKYKLKAMRGTSSMEQVAAVVDECLWRSWFFSENATAAEKQSSAILQCRFI